MSTTQLLQSSPSVKNSLGTVLLLFFGLALIANFSFYAASFATAIFDQFRLFQKYRAVVVAVLHFVLFAICIYAGCRRTFFSNILGPLGAFSLGALYLWFSISGLSFTFDLFLTPEWLMFTSSILWRIAFLFFILSARTWLPVKIFAVIWIIPGAITTILWSTITLTEDSILPFISNFVDIVSAALAILTMVLIVVWMLRKEKTEIA